MKRGPTGHFVQTTTAGEPVRAFIPAPLPPTPPLDRPVFDTLLDEANLALGRLDGAASLLAEPSLFLYQYVRKEALLSSQIEGTQSSFADLLRYENEAAPGVPLDEVREVSNYVAAIDHGMQRIHEGFPLSLRLLLEIHAVLLTGGRGKERLPGEFRRSQNWVGGSRPPRAVFVPPPPEHIIECMGALEKFLHGEPGPTPLLLKAALAHLQFETIHPFLDGNGRLGRLLITLLLCAEGALQRPVLYLSLYLKQRRPEYYELLQSVRLTGDWESWIVFFLEGVRDTANSAVSAIRALRDLFERDAAKVEKFGRAAGSALRLLGFLQSHPLTTIGKAARELQLSIPTVTKLVARLEESRIVREVTGERYKREFAYEEYLRLLSEGTEPLPRFHAP